MRKMFQLWETFLWRTYLCVFVFVYFFCGDFWGILESFYFLFVGFCEVFLNLILVLLL